MILTRKSVNINGSRINLNELILNKSLNKKLRGSMSRFEISFKTIQIVGKAANRVLANSMNSVLPAHIQSKFA